MTRVLAIIAALWCSSPAPTLLAFDPQPYRNVVDGSSTALSHRSCAIEPQSTTRLRAITKLMMQLPRAQSLNRITVIAPIAGPEASMHSKSSPLPTRVCSTRNAPHFSTGSFICLCCLFADIVRDNADSRCAVSKQYD